MFSRDSLGLFKADAFLRFSHGTDVQELTVSYRLGSGDHAQKCPSLGYCNRPLNFVIFSNEETPYCIPILPYYDNPKSTYPYNGNLLQVPEEQASSLSQALPRHKVKASADVNDQKVARVRTKTLLVQV